MLKVQPTWHGQKEYETAIVIGTYNRAHLLKNSLLQYFKTINLQTDCLIIIDDGSTDNTRGVVEDWAGVMDIFYFHFPKPDNVWRDSAAFLNMGISYALNALQCQNVFITHPEIMVGSETVNQAKQAANMQTDKPVWVSAKGYYLTIKQQAYFIDNWSELGIHDNILNVRNIPGFYAQTESGILGPQSDYLHHNMDNHKVWQSWIWGGGNRRLWSYLGGVNESDVWGVVDVDLLNRRNEMGIITITPADERAMVIHQNHDDPKQNTVTPRDMNAVFANMPKRTADEYRAFLNPKRWS